MSSQPFSLISFDKPADVSVNIAAKTRLRTGVQANLVFE